MWRLNGSRCYYKWETPQDVRDSIPRIKLPHRKIGLMIQFLRTTIEKMGVFYLEIGGTNVFARELVDRR